MDGTVKAGTAEMLFPFALIGGMDTVINRGSLFSTHFENKSESGEDIHIHFTGKRVDTHLCRQTVQNFRMSEYGISPER